MRLPLAFVILLALVWVVAASVLASDQPSAGAAKEAAATQPATTRPVVATVTVFCTGDIHEHTAGLARIAGYVKAAKAKDSNVLLFDAGDMMGGFGEEALAVTKGEAMYRLMIAAGYDACVFGNHCHGAGKGRIIELLRKYPKFPLLAANIDWRKEPEDLSKLLPPYKIFQLKGVKVAVIGASSDDLRYARGNRFAVYYQVQAVHMLVPELRKRADIVVAITHEYEEQDYALANSPNAPDLIVGGHSHGATATLWGRAKNSYLLKAGKYTRYLGMVQLKWDGEKIVEKTGKVVRVEDDWPEDAEVKAIRAPYFEEYRKKQEQSAAEKKAAGVAK
jgi:2',3'-cyclic-nucleotide 2'-phosphodiesterase (5'-nucleotidase family)